MQRKNIYLFSYIFILILISIFNKHYYSKLNIEYSKIQNRVNELNLNYTMLKVKMVQITSYDNVLKRAKQLGFIESDVPPKKIIIPYDIQDQFKCTPTNVSE